MKQVLSEQPVARSGGRSAVVLRMRWLVCGSLWLALLGCSSNPVPARPSAPAPSVTSTPSNDAAEVRRRAQLRLELAVGYYEQGKVDIALEELAQVLTLDPSMVDAYNLRGLILMRRNDPRGAEESFRRAMSLSGNDASALHNLGWLLCQQRRFDEARRLFTQALANPGYGERAKTFLTQGICDLRAGQPALAEQSLSRAYELDAGNPVTGYNLALLLYQRGDVARAQFYIRRINNSEFANAETLWLGIRVERRMNNTDAMSQLSEQLRRRFPQSREAVALERGAFNE
jgi:type IV pilus assembly protein PilF